MAGTRGAAGPERAGILCAEQAAYRYPQLGSAPFRDGYGLAPISLAVRPGERLLITGPSGCGKSTLARCLTGLIPHLYRGRLEGRVWLDGRLTADTPLWELAECAGLVFQNPAGQMLAHSVEEEIVFGLENLGLPPAMIRDRLEAALARFDLEAMRARSPQTLSGGEQQKLALAAIMARQPPVLVLDEPLSMLDTTAAADLVAHLAALADAGTALVVCEHRQEMVRAIPDLQCLALPASPDRLDRHKEGIGSPPDPGGDPLGGLRGAFRLPAFDSAGLPSFHLDVSNLTVTLGGRAVLRDLTFAAPGGQLLAIVGRNGIGKTTLLRALAGLQRHEGAVGVDGARPDLGLVFQNADLQLFNASVREEILYRVAEPDLALYAWLLNVLGLARYEDVPPLLLSEGEKKRVALATVVMRRPRHGLLLDEPAVGQDGAHKAMLIRLARALAAAGKLVIVTTHDLALAVQADRLLLLGADGLVADGPPAQVVRDRAAWERLGLPVPDWLREDS